MSGDWRGAVLAAALLGFGVAVAGGLVGRALYQARATERTVTVKGLAEREVDADLAFWPITFTATANELAAAQARIDRDAQRIRAFLRERGFEDAEVQAGPPTVTDRMAEGGYSNQGVERYVVRGLLTVRSPRIAKVQEASGDTARLVADGVALVRDYEVRTQYLFTQLERIKPEMIAEATRDARRAAEQFAHDSGSRVGAIRTAQQGYFSVEDRDAFSPERKKVRVVTTVQYLLED
jgi:uncharacterized protein